MVEQNDLKEQHESKILTVELDKSNNNNTIIFSKDASRIRKEDIHVDSNSSSVKVVSVHSSKSSEYNDIRLNIKPRKSIRL